MRLSVLVLSAIFALAMTDVGSAQANLRNDAVKHANDPGSVKDDAPVREQALDCTCRSAGPGTGAAGSALSGVPERQTGTASPDRDAVAGDESIDCSCRRSVPDTTGALAAPRSHRGPDAEVPGSAGNGAAPSR